MSQFSGAPLHTSGPIAAPSGSFTAAQPSPSAATSTHLSAPPSAALAAPSAPTNIVTVPSTLSPPNGVPNWQTRPVAESAFDFLHWELVSYWTKQLSHTLRGEDPRLIQKKIYAKIESMGFGVGQRYAERYSKDHPYQEQSLDVVKFMCKEFWTLMFRKQIDKLQTNYKGIYVLHDFNFRWIARIYALSPDVDAATLQEQARVYTALACGIIRGALWNLGLNASVKVDLNKLPAIQFTIVEEKMAAAAAAAAAASAAGKPAAAATAANNSAALPIPRSTSTGPLNPSAGVATAGGPAQANRLRTSTSGAGLGGAPPQAGQPRPASGSTGGRP